MTDRPPVPEPDDDGWIREEGARWRNARDGCPHPDLLSVRRSELLDPALHEALTRHIEICDACARFAGDLDAVTAETTLESADARVLAHVRKDVATTGGQWRWVAAAAMLLACGAGAAWWMGSSPEKRPVIRGGIGGTEAPAPQQPEKVTEVAANWTIEAPPIRIPMSALGSVRSGDASEAPAKALAEALVPFRAGRYAEAIPQLDAVATAQPGSVDAAFYLGVARLLADHPGEAIAPLERAAAQAKDARRAEIEWYRATAEQRSGRTAAARSRLDALCAAPGDYRARACAAAQALR